MAYNKTILSLGSIAFNAQRQTMDLDPGIPTTELRFALEGAITVVGADANAVVLDDFMSRLIPNIRLERDGKPIVADIPARDMDAIWRAHIVNQVSQLVPTQTQLRAAGVYPFRYCFGIPFATRWLRDAWDMHMPPLKTRNGLILYIDWAQTALAGADAGTSAGMGAIIDMGTD